MAAEVCCLIHDVNLNDHSKGAHDTFEGEFGGSKADGDLCGKPVATPIKKSSQKQQYSDIDYNMKGKRVVECEDRRDIKSDTDVEYEDRRDIETDSDSDSDVLPPKRVEELTKEELLKYGHEIYDMICRRKLLDKEREMELMNPEWECLSQFNCKFWKFEQDLERFNQFDGKFSKPKHDSNSDEDLLHLDDSNLNEDDLLQLELDPSDLMW